MTVSVDRQLITKKKLIPLKSSKYSLTERFHELWKCITSNFSAKTLTNPLSVKLSTLLCSTIWGTTDTEGVWFLTLHYRRFDYKDNLLDETHDWLSVEFRYYFIRLSDSLRYLFSRVVSFSDRGLGHVQSLFCLWESPRSLSHPVWIEYDYIHLRSEINPLNSKWRPISIRNGRGD